MGIKSLLPFLKPIMSNISLRDIKGCTVAIDTYCWLHRAVLCCSDKIVLGEDTDEYLSYCLRYIKLLELYDIKMILVFDGKNLPAKKMVENKRHNNRENNRLKAFQLMKDNKVNEAREYFNRSVNVSHDVAVKLIKLATSKGLKSLVAPFEADAQLAYLAKQGIVDYVISEDTDLLVFGAPKVLFKLDFNGNAVLIEKNNINKIMKIPLEKYTFDKFRHICIISGCDYFPGIPNIGLVKANKLIQKTQLTDLGDFLKRINTYSNSKIILTKDDVDEAIRADLTFQYQVVYDPISRKQVPFTQYPVGSNCSNFTFAGEPVLNDELAFELAVGKRYPHSYKIVPNFNINFDEWDKAGVFHVSNSTKAVRESSIVEDVLSANATNRKNNKEKKVEVRCDFPWKKPVISIESEYSELLSFYSGDKNGSVVLTDELCNTENDNDISLLLNNASVDEGKERSHDIDYKKVTNPRKSACFASNLSAILRKRSHLSSCESIKENVNTLNSETKIPRLLDSKDSPMLNSKKILARDRLSYLFKKEDS